MTFEPAGKTYFVYSCMQTTHMLLGILIGLVVSKPLLTLMTAIHVQSSQGEGILGFHSCDETAMLVYKPMAKCRSSFAE